LKIPAQLQRGDIGFLIVRKNSKEPVEQGWNKKLYDGFEDRFYDALQDGFNYGISPLTRRIAIVDGDTEEIRKAMSDLVSTFSYSTGKGVQYIFELTGNLEKNIPLKGGAYVKTYGGYAVGPGSIHPNGKMYGEIMNGDHIAVEEKDHFLEVIKPFLLVQPQREFTERQINNGNGNNGKIYTHGDVNKLVNSFEEIWREKDGVRHTLTLALVATLKRNGWSEMDAMNFIAGLVNRTGKGREHIMQVKYIYKHGGGKEYGIPTLIAILNGTLGGENDGRR
jgi:hypothetical protein